MDTLTVGKPNVTFYVADITPFDECPEHVQDDIRTLEEHYECHARGVEFMAGRDLQDRLPEYVYDFFYQRSVRIKPNEMYIVGWNAAPPEDPEPFLLPLSDFTPVIGEYYPISFDAVHRTSNICMKMHGYGLKKKVSLYRV